MKAAGTDKGTLPPRFSQFTHKVNDPHPVVAWANALDAWFLAHGKTPRYVLARAGQPVNVQPLPDDVAAREARDAAALGRTDRDTLHRRFIEALDGLRPLLEASPGTAGLADVIHPLRPLMQALGFPEGALPPHRAQLDDPAAFPKECETAYRHAVDAWLFALDTLPPYESTAGTPASP
jgi:hypothetical protein